MCPAQVRMTKDHSSGTPLVDMNLLPQPSLEETRKVIRWLKRNKTPEANGITDQVITMLWESEAMANNWSIHIINPTFK